MLEDQEQNESERIDARNKCLRVFQSVNSNVSIRLLRSA